MSRTLRAGWACALALVLASCQDYNFNPVGHCLIQPGTKQVTLSSISSADVLFVVDDSGSMAAEQQKLASNFAAFIDNLDAANAARAAAGLEPFDFHIAVTTSSVFWNYETATTCSSSCTGTAGQLVCCKNVDNTPARQPKRCGSDADCAGLAGTTCGINCNGFKGENVCCNQATGAFPLGSVEVTIPCSREGIQCGSLETHYAFASCNAGVAVDQWPFPQGDFVSWTSTSTTNPRVLHFDKELYTGSTNKQGFTRTQLIDFFSGGTSGGVTIQGNVMVGTCGSGEEQVLNAAKRAIEKALGQTQKDTYARTGTGTPLAPVQTWNATTRTAGSAADWLQSTNSKLVLVFVGDEDDCSSPQDPSGGVVMLAEPAGADACTRDVSTAAPLGQKEYTVDSFADYFTSLGRPLGAAFILPAAQTTCSGDTCTAGPTVCCSFGCPEAPSVCTNSSTCGAQAPGYRYLAEANALRTRGADVVLGSICDSNFGTILNSIADLVKPPTGLALPSLPAQGDVTVLRIAESSGQTRKVCGRPAPPASYPSLAAAQAATDPATGRPWDWWFTQGADVITVTAAVPQPWNPVAVSQFVYINPSGSCIANPGETYSADYLGQVPAGGCWNTVPTDPTYYPPAAGSTETSGDAMCRATLGGAAGSWTCYGGVNAAQACVATTQTSPGTCICGSAAANCPAGRLP
ncbi:MAG TPA: hypothetical protein VF841_00700 [Anaeromyxobacter sp.]